MRKYTTLNHKVSLSLIFSMNFLNFLTQLLQIQIKYRIPEFTLETFTVVKNNICFAIHK